MTSISRWYAVATVGAALLLGACGDQLRQPLTPELARFNVGTTSSHLPDELYLIDNICPTTNPLGTECLNFGNGSRLYRVDLTGGNAVMTLLFSALGPCTTNRPDINCTTTFDQAHIGATPDGAQIWLVQQAQPSPGVNPVGIYDVGTGTFSYRGEITGIDQERGLVLAGFSPDGGLFLANQLNETLYRIDAATLTIQQTWQVRIGGGSGPILDLHGADIAFDAQGRLFAYTNRATATQARGLYRITFSGADAIATHVGEYGQFYTGLAFRAAGTGNIVLSDANSDMVREVNVQTSALVASYPMTSALTDHRFGDMTTGRLGPPPPPPAPGLAISKTAGAGSVAAGNPISFTIAVESNGSVPAQNVTLTDTLPGGLGINWSVSPLVVGCAISGTNPQVLTCSFGQLAPGEMRSVTVGTATQAASCGLYDNTATAAATGVTPVSDDATIDLKCPQPPTGICEGGVTKLVVKYIGTVPLAGAVSGQRVAPGTGPRLAAQTSGVGPNTLYTFAITPLGGLFAPVANGRLANEFRFFVNNVLHQQLHTSCSVPIYPGQRFGPANQQFEIVAVFSLKGGEIGAP